MKRWDKYVNELKEFYKDRTLPEGPIKIDQATTIINTSLFVSTHMRTVEKYNGNPVYSSYLKRLYMLKEFIENNP